ncbi:hypothetical protein LIER_05830 [Lithospermum erythrorhizon]|uniref:DUF7356 domain-containing protein n=1 Tax=Lithospermum erythrorhizon TaxID=34254 RepID=A0AAV3P1Y5_LITER
MSGSRGSTLLLRNDGKSDLKLNVTLFPVNYTYNNVHIPKHEVRKINISSNIRECSSIRVSGEDGGCTIALGVVAPLDKLYKGYATPVNAAYILFGTVVLIGGMWACYKFRHKGRHLDGVPYEELEIVHQKQPLPYVESTDNWNESWDDDYWDEEQAVRSPGENHLQSRLSNGASS